MTDYTEIAKWLRGCAEHDGRHGMVYIPTDGAKKAADAIEELCEANGELYNMVESCFEIILCAEKMAISFTTTRIAENGGTNPL